MTTTPDPTNQPTTARIVTTAQVILHAAVQGVLDETRDDLDRAYATAADPNAIEMADLLANWRDELAEWLDRHPLPLSVQP